MAPTWAARADINAGINDLLDPVVSACMQKGWVGAGLHCYIAKVCQYIKALRLSKGVENECAFQHCECGQPVKAINRLHRTAVSHVLIDC